MPTSSKTTRATRARRLLVVDDDPIVRRVLIGCLSQFGHEVLAAEDGEGARHLCASTPVDLAIIDYYMPGFSGLQTAEIILREHAVPFIFLTSSDDEQVMRSAVKVGAHGYLVKPVEPHQLVAAVESALSRSKDAQHMQVAIEQTRKINVAIGILAVEHNLLHEEAVAKLQSICRPRRISARRAAGEIIRAWESRVRSGRTGQAP